MKALTVRQPWAGLIARGVKDVENRTWAPSIALGTRFAIHAGRRDDATRIIEHSNGADLEHPMCLVSGVVVCTVELVDVRRDSRSRWAIDGHWHWVLDDVYALVDPDAWYMSERHVRGRTGLWELDE